MSGWTWNMIDNWCAGGTIGARRACRRRRSCRLGSIAQQLMLQYLAVAFLTEALQPGRPQILGAPACFKPVATSTIPSNFFPVPAPARPPAALFIMLAA